MKEALRCQYHNLVEAWKNGLSGEFRRSAIAFGWLFLLSFGACMALPNLREQAIGLILKAVDIESLQQNGVLSAPALFINNLQATALTMTYGLLPFLFLAALPLGVNAVLLGVLAAWYLAGGYSPAAYLAALLPHGIFELPALICAFAVGLYVCGQLSRRCRRDETALPLWGCLVLISETLILVITPLLLAAALVEAYLTPVIAAYFF